MNIKYIFPLLISLFLTLSAAAQEPTLKDVLWTDNLKLEIKSGVVTILSPVPEKYLSYTNHLNVPVEVPGMLGSFSAKRRMTPHWELGYQLDYLRVQGNTRDAADTRVVVRTQALTHWFQTQYNFKRNDVFKPRFNYFVYYKMGGISVKNDRIGSYASDARPREEKEEKGQFNSNVAVMSGIGTGVNYQLSDHLSLSCGADLNRSSNKLGEIFYLHKLFYNSSNTVNKFAELSVGLTYWFSWRAPKKGYNYYRPRNETQQLILKRKIERKKGKASRSNHSGWYDPSRGK